MKEKTGLHHVALQYDDKNKAEFFFTKVLGLKLKKTFTLSKELSKKIFRITEEVVIFVYANDYSYFEIFITNRKTKYSYEHVSIKIENKNEFIKRCKRYDIKTIIVKKGEKTLLFIKDYVGNLYEIKERTK
jgi:catechol 2,3-dioxygenase-like lactoylglutathione lyase family enzyme